MSFANDNLWFRTLADFDAYLVRLPRPSWKPIGCTFHNTYRPDEQQWAGRASLVSDAADLRAESTCRGRQGRICTLHRARALTASL